MKLTHLPPELVPGDGCPPFLRRALDGWKGRAAPEPRMAASRLRVSGFGPQHEFHGIRARLPQVESPHGLLFRTEDNLSFAVKVFSGWARLDLSVAGETDARSLSYHSVRNASNGNEWTPTLPRLGFLFAGYGAEWGYHFSTMSTDAEAMKILGLELERKRVLLLAISPGRNPLFRGIDKDELVVRDRIGLRRILILNDSPELVRRIIQIESDHWGTGREVMDRMMERFGRLERADGPSDPFAKRR